MKKQTLKVAPKRKYAVVKKAPKKAEVNKQNIKSMNVIIDSMYDELDVIMDKKRAIQPEYYGKGYDIINLCQENNINFTRGSAIKYIVRAGKKGVTTEIVDLQKAIECLNREIAYLKNRG